MSDALERLSAALQGAGLPEPLGDLSDDEILRLVQSVERLKAHQESELERAVDDALSHIPALLRRSVRKMLFS